MDRDPVTGTVAVKGVRQSRVSAVDGDCWRACLATIFECQLGEAPAPPPSPESWEPWVDEVLQPWLMDRGVFLYTVDVADPDGNVPEDLISIGGTKKGPIGAHHAVVFRGRECVWDPEVAGPGKFTLHDLEQISLFVALDPVRCQPPVYAQSA